MDIVWYSTKTDQWFVFSMLLLSIILGLNHLVHPIPVFKFCSLSNWKVWVHSGHKRQHAPTCSMWTRLSLISFLSQHITVRCRACPAGLWGPNTADAPHGDQLMLGRRCVCGIRMMLLKVGDLIVVLWYGVDPYWSQCDRYTFARNEAFNYM